MEVAVSDRTTELGRVAIAAAAVHGHVRCPLEHVFSEGLYARKLVIPKGTIVVGKVHRRETLNICAMGDISVLTDKGVARFHAGDVIVSAPGIRKIGYAHEDTVWVNVHPTDETDLDVIENMFTIPGQLEQDMDSIAKQLGVFECLG